jgi:hypothetical protein
MNRKKKKKCDVTRTQDQIFRHKNQVFPLCNLYAELKAGKAEMVGLLLLKKFFLEKGRASILRLYSQQLQY